MSIWWANLKFVLSVLKYFSFLYSDVAASNCYAKNYSNGSEKWNILGYCIWWTSLTIVKIVVWLVSFTLFPIPLKKFAQPQVLWVALGKLLCFLSPFRNAGYDSDLPYRNTCKYCLLIPGMKTSTEALYWVDRSEFWGTQIVTISDAMTLRTLQCLLVSQQH